jgi:purine-nucleoside phosphorylase
MEKAIVIPYNQCPEGFPQSTVVGHAGEFVFGTIGSKNVMCMRGRFHQYEGYTGKQCVIGIRLMAAMGVKMMIVTNAAGGVNRSFNIGDVMLIRDHISFPGMAGFNPLTGPNDARFGPRFPSMSNAYDRDLRTFAKQVASELKEAAPTLQEGCYLSVNGPSYETPSEISMVRTMGADTVGMSTVHEVTAAVHSGVRVLGFSLVTNACLGVGDVGLEPTHQEVIDNISAVQTKVEDLVRAIVDRVDISAFPQSPAYWHFLAARIQNS